MIEKACSDDETEDEGSSSGPCLIRRLPWRSLEVDRIMEALDVHRNKVTQSIPKNSQGRPPRPRVRTPAGPLSPIKIPEGLPEDCYNMKWVDENRSAFQKSQLKIQPRRLLTSLISTVNEIPVSDPNTTSTPTRSGSGVVSGSLRPRT